MGVVDYIRRDGEVPPPVYVLLGFLAYGLTRPLYLAREGVWLTLTVLVLVGGALQFYGLYKMSVYDGTFEHLFRQWWREKKPKW
jgi:hypothetical protein